MGTVLGVLVVMEMVAINLVTVDRCAARKYPGFQTAAALALFTAALTCLTGGLWPYIGFLEGNALFAVIGVVYLVPLHWLYREPVRYIQSVLFSVWIYTLLTYCIAVRVAYIWPGGNLIACIFAAQTAVYAATLAVFFSGVRRGLLFVLQNITDRIQRLLQCVSLSWFVFLILINGLMIYTSVFPLKAAVMAVLTVNALLSYYLIYAVVKSGREVRDLEGVIHIDALTGLPNRVRLFRDGELLCAKGRPFRLFYLDLNRFKSINDQYGHTVGDQYLQEFARLMRGGLTGTGTLYRMSGDEFIILCDGGGWDAVAAKLRQMPARLEGMQTPFLGYSFGWADYPAQAQALDQLILLADRRMYEDKHPGGAPKER